MEFLRGRGGKGENDESWFQSLSGFWWSFCVFACLRVSAASWRCFNPFQGFGGVSAYAVGMAPAEVVEFQSLSGFWWSFCKNKRSSKAVDLVSGFNPFQGFGGVSAAARKVGEVNNGTVVSIPFRVLVEFLHPMAAADYALADAEFQSLSGFWWSFCEPRESLSHKGEFFVSIPFRVLVEFLRARARGVRGGGAGRFNPFQGFGGVSAPTTWGR